MNAELKEAIEALVKEKRITEDTLFDAIENALLTACKNNYGRTDNIRVEVDRDTFDYHCWAAKEVVPEKDDVMDDLTEISLEDARKVNKRAQVGDTVEVDLDSKSFGRIATQIAKNVILQKIREEERSVVYNEYSDKQKQVVTGIVERSINGNITVNLGTADAILNEKEQVKSEHLKPMDRVKVYIVDVRNTSRGPRILVSRTHPELVRKLFEQEVTEIQEGIVEIKAIAREAGSRTKIAVWSNDPDNVDAVGACVGVNGVRVNSIVNELHGEKIDIIEWDENPSNLIQNALSPAKVVAVYADPEERTAKVVVPDMQLSLAIGREGQNARLAAKLTGYKIDIKSETQAKDAPGFRAEDYEDYELTDGYDENGEYIGDEYYDEDEDAGDVDSSEPDQEDEAAQDSEAENSSEAESSSEPAADETEDNAGAEDDAGTEDSTEAEDNIETEEEPDPQQDGTSDADAE